jgi:3-oxoacyl-[acyl-carrier-protein] synthase-3
MKEPQVPPREKRPARRTGRKAAKPPMGAGGGITVSACSAEVVSKNRRRAGEQAPTALATSKTAAVVAEKVGKYMPLVLRRSQRTASVIAGTGKYVPEQVMTSDYIEEKLGFGTKFAFPRGSIEAITGVRERRYISDGQISSDMAYEAAKVALERAGVEPGELDTVIFASASHDIAEPATANVLQAKLGATNAHCLDAKNACNSFLNGVDIMDAFIKTGRCKIGLVAAGEVLSKFVRWDIKTPEELETGFSAFTLGDGGGAIVFKAEEDEGRGIHETHFKSDGRAWDLATIMGGGTLCPFDLSKNYFVSHSSEINKLAIKHIPRAVKWMMGQNGWRLDDVDLVVPHQVTRSITERLMKIVGLPIEKAMITVNKYGNTAAASVPIAFADAVEEGRVGPDSRVMLVGGASGFSVGVVMAVL